MLRLALSALVPLFFAPAGTQSTVKVQIELPEGVVQGPVEAAIVCSGASDETQTTQIDAKGSLKVRGEVGSTCVVRFALGEQSWQAAVVLGDHEFETVTARQVHASAVRHDTDGTVLTVDMEEMRSIPVGASTSRDFTAVVDMAPAASRDAAGIALAGTTGAAQSRFRAGTLTAGAVDDLATANGFAKFMDGNDAGAMEDLVGKRWAGVRVTDAKGRALAGVPVRVGSTTVKTRADGSAVFVEGLDAIDNWQQARAEVGGVRSVQLRPGHVDRVTIKARPRKGMKADLLLVVDTTGSMADELSYLQVELEAILARIEKQHAGVDLRWGLIVYRDRGDAYVVRGMNFTRDFPRFQAALAQQRAMGGGDMPEAVHSAFEAANRFDWRPASEAARLVVHVADAPPHDQQMSAALEAVRDLRDEGTAVYPVASSGVDGRGEFFMRSAALMTAGQYVFLTDDSGYGGSHREATASCFRVETLAGVLGKILDAELQGERPQLPPGDRGECSGGAGRGTIGGMYVEPARGVPRRVPGPSRHSMERSLFDDDAAARHFHQPYVRRKLP